MKYLYSGLIGRSHRRYIVSCSSRYRLERKYIYIFK